VFFVQGRTRGTDPQSRNDLPAWVRAALLALAVIAVPVGVILFLAPQAIAPLWPWALTPLTGRVVGAWFCANGVAAASVWWENDTSRVVGPLAGLFAFAVLESSVLLRYAGTVDWGRPVVWGYVLFLLALLVVTGAGLLYGRRVGRVGSKVHAGAE
jgi:hypothetical protein